LFTTVFKFYFKRLRSVQLVQHLMATCRVDIRR